MSNLTIVVDDDIVKQARVRALQDGTSLSAKVREFLVAYAQGAPKRSPRDATAELMRLMEAVRAEVPTRPLARGRQAVQAQRAVRRRFSA